MYWYSIIWSYFVERWFLIPQFRIFMCLFFAKEFDFLIWCALFLVRNYPFRKFYCAFSFVTVTVIWKPLTGTVQLYFYFLRKVRWGRLVGVRLFVSGTSHTRCILWTGAVKAVWEVTQSVEDWCNNACSLIANLYTMLHLSFIR